MPMDHHELNDMIDRLRRMVDEPEAPDRGHWRPVWDVVSEVGVAFRLVSYPSTEENDAAWAKYQDAISSAKRRIQELRVLHQEKRQAVWEGRRQCGQQIIGKVQRMADGVTSSARLAEAELAAAHASVCSRKGSQAAEWPFADINDLRKALSSSKKRLFECDKALQAVWTEFRDSKEGMLPDDKDAVYGMLTEVKRALNKSWSQWRERSVELQGSCRKLRHEQRLQREMVEKNIASRNARKKRASKRRAVSKMIKFRGGYR